MKFTNAEIFKKNKKKNIILLVISLIFLILTCLIVYFGIENSNKQLPNPINMNDIINKEKKDDNIYSYIDANTKPYLFAVYESNGVEEDNKYYFVMDNDNKLYIVYMNDELFDKLNIDEIEKSNIRILGLTKYIPNDIKEYAIESYNNLMNDEYLTKDNFKKYVGFVYLDTTKSIYNYEKYYISAIITGSLFFITTTIYLIIIIKNKILLKKISNEELANIDAELSHIQNNKYNDMNLFILKDYIIDINNKISIINYKDIIWAYPYEKRYNGLLISKFIKIKTKDNKNYLIANTKKIEENNDEIINEILNILKDKNNEIILEYNKENKEKIKKIIKENKNK